MTISTVSIPNNRLVFVSNCAWSMYNFRAELLEYFVERDYEVHVIASHDAFSKKLEKMGCIVHSIEFNSRGLNPIKDIQFFNDLKKLYSEIQPALIFHYFIKPNIYGTLAAHQLRIPSIAIVTGLGYSFQKKNWLHLIVQQLYKFSFKKATQVWFLNDDDKNFFVDNNLVDSHKSLRLKSEGINTKKFYARKLQTEKKNFVFLMATRLLKAKGIETYAAAAFLLKSKYPNIECRLVGLVQRNHPDSICVKRLDAWISQSIIRFDGGAEDVIPHILDADCFVLPSYYHEGVPRSLMEACSLRIPVIASAIKGCKEVVTDQKNGLLCLPQNAEDLAAKMEAIYLMSYEERAVMGEIGRKKMVTEYDVSDTVLFYKEVVDKFITQIHSESLEPVA